MSFFFFLFFLLSLNWEREYVIAILRKSVGRNRLNVHLAFFGGFLLRVFSLLRASGILHSSAWMCLSSCPRALCRFFTWSLAWDSPVCSLRPLFQNWFPYPYFRWRKGGYFRFRVLANHIASFFCQAILSDYYLFHPITECKHLLASILTWICYFGREELTYIPYSFNSRPKLTYIPYSSFNGQSLVAC